MRAEEAAEQGRLRFVAVLGGAIASGIQLEAWFALLDDELGPLAPLREAFERAEAQRWLEQQARTLKPRKPRKTQGWIRRNGMAQRAAARAAGLIR